MELGLCLARIRLTWLAGSQVLWEMMYACCNNRAGEREALAPRLLRKSPRVSPTQPLLPLIVSFIIIIILPFMF